MDPDIALVLGIVLAGFAIPAAVSAYSDQRPPRASALSVLIAGGLVLYALWFRAEGYTWAEIPEAFVRVLAMVIG